MITLTQTTCEVNSGKPYYQTHYLGQYRLIIQICEAEDIEILKGVVSKDHVHLHIEYRPSQSVSDMVKKLKGRCSRKLQQEFPELNKRYWGRHFWAIGYGCWSTGNITDEMVNEYLEHHRNPRDNNESNFIVE